MALEVYDPEDYWDAKARASQDDPVGAVCWGDPLRDRCIDAVQKRLLRMAFDHISVAPGAKPSVLDFGCGTGRWSEFWRARGFEYSGIDISTGMVEIARREHPSGSFEKFDGLKIPHAGGSFDVVVSIAVLHHNAYENQDIMLDEMARVLKPGGTLVVFEGVGPPTAREDEAAVFHLRPAAEWEASLKRRGMNLVWRRGARYFALESLVEAVARRLPAGHRERTPDGSTGLLSRLALRLGRRVDPWLISRRLSRFHDRAMFVFRR